MFIYHPLLLLLMRTGVRHGRRRSLLARRLLLRGDGLVRPARLLRRRRRERRRAAVGRRPLDVRARSRAGGRPAGATVVAERRWLQCVPVVVTLLTVTAAHHSSRATKIMLRSGSSGGETHGTRLVVRQHDCLLYRAAVVARGGAGRRAHSSRATNPRTFTSSSRGSARPCSRGSCSR